MDKSSEFIFSKKIVNYNSKLPLVIFVPKGFELKYKFWAAEEEIESAEIQ